MSSKLREFLRGKQRPTMIRELARKIDVSVSGFLSDEEGELLYNLGATCPRGGTIVEIGSWKGRSTCWFGLGVQAHSHAKIYAVDPHVGIEPPEHQTERPGYTIDAFQTNIRTMGIQELIIPINKYSHNALNDVCEEIDVLFIDGDHEYESVHQDFELWFPKLKNEGIIAFHDSVGKGWPGVFRLMKEEIFPSRTLKEIRFIGTITYGKKVEKNTLSDRLKNRVVQGIKWLHEMRSKVPQPYRAIEHHLIKRRLQRRWIEKINPFNHPSLDVSLSKNHKK